MFFTFSNAWLFSSLLLTQELEKTGEDPERVDEIKTTLAEMEKILSQQQFAVCSDDNAELEDNDDEHTMTDDWV